MRRVLAVVASGMALASCSSTPSWDWIKPSGDAFRSSPQTVVLRFESEPQGAEARLPNGQACRTPCALAAPAQSMTVVFSLNGYLPQSVPVQVMLPEDLRTDSEITTAPSARLDPNPVYAELALAPPPKRAAPRRPAPRPAARPATTQAPAAAPARQAPMAAPQSSPAAPWPAPAR